jgi:putative glycerol-1-phosphate prenyltransferase
MLPHDDNKPLHLHNIDRIEHSAHTKGFAVLIDPDKTPPEQAAITAYTAVKAGAVCIFVGGSFIRTDSLTAVTQAVKKAVWEASQTLPAHPHLPQAVPPPVLLFPGDATHLSAAADGVLLLSLLSGRNAEYLIGRHVLAAPHLAEIQKVNPAFAVIPTAYILVEGGRVTSVQYISGTLPIPADKPELTAATALAGHYLGLACTYLDAGSGALQPIPPATIAAVRAISTKRLIVGGGIRTVEAAAAAWNAGADWVVIGTAIEAPLTPTAPSTPHAPANAAKLLTELQQWLTYPRTGSGQ